MTLSIVILPAKVLSNGTHKIRISVAHNGTTRYLQTRFVVPSVDCLKNGIVTSKVSNASYINQQLRSMQTKIYNAYDEIESAECYTCSQLIQLIEDRMNSNKAKTFESIAQEWLLTKKQTCAATTCELYEKYIDLFISFVGKGFLMSLLSSKKVWEYDAFLSKKYPSNTTINIAMSTLRGITNLAINRRYVSYDTNPFDDYKNRNIVIRDCAIPVSVLRMIRDFKTESFALQRSADIFMLSFYLAGMNISDMMELDFSKDSVSFIRQKTIRRRTDNMKTEFDIQPEAREIINKYIGKDGRLQFAYSASKGVVKKGLTGNLNRELKNLAKAIGYDGKLILYSSRKTFSQLCFLHNVQERVIAYCIGDSTKKSNDVLSHYVNANKHLADDCIRKVLDFVNGSKTENDLLGGNDVVQR